MDIEKLAAEMKALSSETRVRIIGLLGRRPLCAGAIADRLGASPSSTSQHLRVLKDAGLVTGERRGMHIHYRLNRDSLRDLIDRLDSLYDLAADSDQCCAAGQECRSQKKKGD